MDDNLDIEQLLKDAAANVKKRPASQALESFRDENEQSPETVKSIADMLCRDSVSMYMFGMSSKSALGIAPYAAIEKYVAAFITSLAGHDCQDNPRLRNAIERLIIMQHMSSRLICDAANASDVQARQVNGQLALQFAGELRRLEVEIDKELRRDTESRKSSDTRETANEKKRGGMRRTA